MDQELTVPSLQKGLYQHYKGNKYEVLGVGRHTETLEYFVVYSPIEQKEGMSQIWLRPYNMFVEDVEVDGKVISRFQKLD